MPVATRKRCARCGQCKPLSAFNRNKRSSDGLDRWCRSCCAEYKTRYYKRNAEKIKAKARSRYVKKRVPKTAKQRQKENREYQQVYYRKHRAKKIEQAKDWMNANPERRQAITRKSARKAYAKDPEKFRERERRRRALKAKVKERFTRTMDRFVRAFWQDTCALCGRVHAPEEHAFPVDHWLPLSDGNALAMDNAVLLCQSCNVNKASRNPRNLYSARTVKKIERRLRMQMEAWLRKNGG